MGSKVKVDARGRITIPTEERQRFGIKNGDELEIFVKGPQIVLVPVRKEVKKIKLDRKWGDDAFLSAGEATFGD